MNADGYVTIGTKLDTKDFEKGLKQAENELNRLDKEAKRLADQKVKIEFDNSKLQETIDKYDAMQNEANDLRNKLKEMRDAGFMWMTSYDKTEAKLNSVNSQIQKHENSMIKTGNQIEKNNLKLELINKKIKDNGTNQEILNKKISQMNTELAKTQTLGGIKGAIDGIQDKMSGIVKTAIKWGLAVFGVRSAYMFVRNAISTLTQYDKQLATDVEYIRWALAMSLKPVIEFIIKLAYQLLGILRYIIKFLFNYDIFAKAGAEQFRKAKESTGGVANNLGTATKKAKALNKELNKQLASFDEMNILGDNVKQAGDTGSAGGTPAVGGSDITMPSMEIPEIKDIKINIDWSKVFDTILEKIDLLKEKIQKKVKEIFDDIGDKWITNGEKLGGILGDWSKSIGTFFKNLGDIIQLEIDGIADIFKGLVRIIKGIFTGDIQEVIKGGFEIIKGVFKTAIAGLGAMFNVLSTVWRGIFDTWKRVINSLWSGIVNAFTNIVNGIKNKFTILKNAIITIFKNIGTSVGKVFQSAFKTIFNKLMATVQSTINKPISAINSLISVINKVLPKSKRMSKLKTIKLPRLATGGIVNMPGKGVPVGTAIAGERGAEGVIPLTDSQQMALLGEAIGKYITINANITNNMNGRVISRELQKVQNDNNFAYNR